MLNLFSKGREMKKLITWFKQEDGASAMEYALIAALAAVLFGGAYALLAEVLLDFFSTFIDDINPF